jgi:hypothetical protein
MSFYSTTNIINTDVFININDVPVQMPIWASLRTLGDHYDDDAGVYLGRGCKPVVEIDARRKD